MIILHDKIYNMLGAYMIIIYDKIYNILGHK